MLLVLLWVWVLNWFPFSYNQVYFLVFLCVGVCMQVFVFCNNKYRIVGGFSSKSAWKIWGNLTQRSYFPLLCHQQYTSKNGRWIQSRFWNDTGLKTYVRENKIENNRTVIAMNNFHYFSPWNSHYLMNVCAIPVMGNVPVWTYFPKTVKVKKAKLSQYML
jgi:hypothetical protein